MTRTGRKDVVRVAVFIVGVALATAGVAAVCWPASLVVLGSLLVLAAWKV